MTDHPEPDDKPTGDYIAGHIGENACNVAVGKNIIQIGSLQIPYYLAVIIALCLLIGLGFVAYPSVKPWLPKPLAFAPAAQNETLILIATFQVTEGNHNTLAQREIRDKIRAKIQELHETNLRAEVEPTVLNADQRAEAETLGKRYRASMVIWGDDTGARVTVNFLNLRQPDFDAASVTISETARTQLANPSAYAKFITTDLPQVMSFFALFAVGQAYYVNTQYASAITSIEAAIAQLPSGALPLGLAEANFRLGWLYYQPPVQLEQTIINYTKTIRLNPDYAIAYNNRGLTFVDLDKYDEAIIDFDKAIQLSPNLAEVYNNRGVVRYAQQRLDEAIAGYDKAIQLNPNLAVAYNNRGNVRADQHKYDEAIIDFDKAIQLSPNLAKAYNNHGLARANQQELDKAIIDFDSAIRLKPDYANAYYNRGNARADQHKDNEAIADYDKAIQLKPDFAEAYNNRGLARAIKHRFYEAITDYDKAIQLKPSFAEAYNNRGIALVGQNKQDEAITDYDKAIQLKPDFANAYNNRGAAHYAQHKYDESITDFDKAIQFQANMADAYYNRGLARKTQEDLAGALADYRRYLQILPAADDRPKVEQWITELEAALAKQQ